MNANQLADAIEPLVLTSFHETQYIGRQAAILLRRQHEAIVKLREALKEIQGYVLEHGAEYVVAEQALQETSEFSK